MKEPLLIAAGENGSRPINGEKKPYLQIDGRTVIERVVQAARHATSVDNIYIWGNKPRLEQVLQNELKEDQKYHPERSIVILNENKCLIENIVLTLINEVCKRESDSNFHYKNVEDIEWRAFSNFIEEHHLKTKSINLIPADTPLILPQEIDYLINNKPKDQYLLAGLTKQSSLKSLIEKAPEPFDLDKSGLTFFTLYDQGNPFKVRINNYWGGQVLFLEEPEWVFTQNIFMNRHFVIRRRSGKAKDFDVVKIVKLLYHINKYRRHLKKSADSKAEYRDAFSNIRKTIYALQREYKNRPKEKDKEYLGLDWIKDSVTKATGKKISVYITPVVGLLLDIDADSKGYSYEYEYLKNPKNFYHLRERQLELYDKIDNNKTMVYKIYSKVKGIGTAGIPF